MGTSICSGDTCEKLCYQNHTQYFTNNSILTQQNNKINFKALHKNQIKPRYTMQQKQNELYEQQKKFLQSLLNDIDKKLKLKKYPYFVDFLNSLKHNLKKILKDKTFYMDEIQEQWNQQELKLDIQEEFLQQKKTNNHSSMISNLIFKNQFLNNQSDPYQTISLRKTNKEKLTPEEMLFNTDHIIQNKIAKFIQVQLESNSLFLKVIKEFNKNFNRIYQFLTPIIQNHHQHQQQLLIQNKISSLSKTPQNPLKINANNNNNNNFQYQKSFGSLLTQVHDNTQITIENIIQANDMTSSNSVSHKSQYKNNKNSNNKKQLQQQKCMSKISNEEIFQCFQFNQMQFKEEVIQQINDLLINILYQLLCNYFEAPLDKMMYHWQKNKQNWQIYIEQIQIDDFNDEILEIIYNLIFTTLKENNNNFVMKNLFQSSNPSQLFLKIMNMYKILSQKTMESLIVNMNNEYFRKAENFECFMNIFNEIHIFDMESQQEITNWNDKFEQIFCTIIQKLQEITPYTFTTPFQKLQFYYKIDKDVWPILHKYLSDELVIKAKTRDFLQDFIVILITKAKNYQIDIDLMFVEDFASSQQKYYAEFSQSYSLFQDSVEFIKKENFDHLQ